MPKYTYRVQVSSRYQVVELTVEKEGELTINDTLNAQSTAIQELKGLLTNLNKEGLLEERKQPSTTQPQNKAPMSISTNQEGFAITKDGKVANSKDGKPIPAIQLQRWYNNKERPKDVKYWDKTLAEIIALGKDL